MSAEKVTLRKNQEEIFKCHFSIEGASMKDTVVRLCLEFEDNINYFFYGDLKENGDCVIKIPKLKNVEQESCKLTVEALADSIYFKVYEAQAELKNSVEVSMQKPTIVNGQPKTKVEVEVEQVVVESKKNPFVAKPEKVEKTEEKPEKASKKDNPFVVKTEKDEKPEKSFKDFMRKKRNSDYNN